MRGRRCGIALPVTAALLLTGCATPGEQRPRGPEAPAEVVAEATCAGADPFGGGATDVVAMGRVPEGFEAVAAYRCDPFATVEDEAGLWSGVAGERLEGDLDPLLAALRVPDSPTLSEVCPAMMVVMPELWLIDGAGGAVRVRHPVDGCGFPMEQERVQSALASLTVTKREVERTGLVESRAAMDAGCPTGWQAQPLRIAGAGDVTLTDGTTDPAAPGGTSITLAPGSAPSPGDVDELRLCAYSTGEEAAPRPPVPAEGAHATVHAGGTAWFTGARELDAARTREVLEAVASAPSTVEGCREVPGRLVVLHPEGHGPLWVELDGCRRVVVEGLTAAQATDGLIALLDDLVR